MGLVSGGGFFSPPWVCLIQADNTFSPYGWKNVHADCFCGLLIQTHLRKFLCTVVALLRPPRFCKSSTASFNWLWGRVRIYPSFHGSSSHPFTSFTVYGERGTFESKQVIDWRDLKTLTNNIIPFVCTKSINSNSNLDVITTLSGCTWNTIQHS